MVDKKDISERFKKIHNLCSRKDLRLEDKYKLVEQMYKFICAISEPFNLHYDDVINTIEDIAADVEQNNFQQNWFLLSEKYFPKLYLEFENSITEETPECKLSFAIPSARLQMAEETAKEILKFDSSNIEVVVCHSADIFECTDQFDIEIDDPRFRIVHNEANKDLAFGGTHNFIEVIKHCKGEYVWMLSDKDTPFQNGIQSVMDVINKVNNVTRISANPTENEQTNYIVTDSIDESLMIKPVVYNLSETIFRRDTFDLDYEYVISKGDELKFYPHSVISIRAAQYGRSVIFTNPLYFRDMNRTKNRVLVKYNEKMDKKYENLTKPNYSVIELPYVTPAKRAAAFKGFIDEAFKIIVNNEAKQKYFIILYTGYCYMVSEMIFNMTRADGGNYQRVDMKKNLDEFHGIILEKVVEMASMDDVVVYKEHMEKIYKRQYDKLGENSI